LQRAQHCTAKVLAGFIVAATAATVQHTSAWLPFAVSNGPTAVRAQHLSSKTSTYGILRGHPAREHLALAPLLLSRPWHYQGFSRPGKRSIALHAKKKKKKHVDDAVLEKRAKAAAIREEALRKAAETKRLKAIEDAKSEEVPAKPMAATSRTVTAAEGAKMTPTRSATARKATPPARKSARSVEEMRAIRALDGQAASTPKKRVSKATSGIKDVKPDKSGGMLPTEEEVMKMKVVDLKDVLRRVGLKVSGRKAELLERVLTHIRAA